LKIGVKRPLRLRNKILLTIVLAVGYWLLIQHTKPRIAGNDNPCSAVPIMTQTELQAWYKSYNNLYFNNHLPRNINIEWVDLHSKLRMGETQCTQTLKLDGPSELSCVIRLDPVYNLAFPVAKATLLHEMCHVKTYDEFDDHGRRWQACMQELWMDKAFDGLI
jgi:hypothetical protein